MTPKILFFDLETAPCEAWTWGLYNELTSMEFIKSDWYVLCWAAKWLGSKEMMSEGQYSKSKNDKRIVKKLWKLFDEADIIVAHNAVKFDVRKANTRFIKNGLKPPSPPKVVDTLKTARKYFAFTSNRLGDLGNFLGLGTKKANDGFGLWKKCMVGDKKAWKEMVEYCETDVSLLEKVYVALRSYAGNHPNMGVYTGTMTCKCGSTNLQRRGYATTNANRYQRYQCQDCGSWCRDKISTLGKGGGKKLTANVA
jgi:hypothetical protein